MKPDHEAAKNAAKLLRDFFTFSSGEYGEREQRNLAVSYLDLVSREQRAVELLREMELCAHNELMTGDMPEEGVHTSQALAMAAKKARAFLAERDGEV